MLRCTVQLFPQLSTGIFKYQRSGLSVSVMSPVILRQIDAVDFGVGKQFHQECIVTTHRQIHSIQYVQVEEINMFISIGSRVDPVLFPKEFPVGFQQLPLFLRVFLQSLVIDCHGKCGEGDFLLVRTVLQLLTRFGKKLCDQRLRIVGFSLFDQEISPIPSKAGHSHFIQAVFLAGELQEFLLHLFQREHGFACGVLLLPVNITHQCNKLCTVFRELFGHGGNFFFNRSRHSGTSIY